MKPLPGASQEVKGILNILSRDVTGFTGTNASEAAYKQIGNHYEYIHFATHGYVDRQNPNYSALLLNAGSPEEDGLLHVYEIYDYPLRAELVVLSACETALGKYQGGEGLISFVQAFFSARARNVVASLWRVNDASYPIMISFYKHLEKDETYAEALRNAKLDFILGQKNGSNSLLPSPVNPFLWAPLVLFGF